MSDDLDHIAAEAAPPGPISHDRVLVLMAFIGIIGSVATFFYISAHFASGFFIGAALAFVNYFWLKRTIASAFAGIGREDVAAPRMSAFTYFVRYLAMGAAIAVLYASGAVSVVGLLSGMAIFGLAVVAESLIRIFTTLFGSEG